MSEPRLGKAVLVDAAGAEIGTADSPLSVNATIAPAAGLSTEETLANLRDDVADGVAITSSALPTGAATAAAQATANASLASLDAKLPALSAGRLVVDVQAWLGATTPSVGQKTGAASLPVVLASDQSAVAVADGGGSLTIDGSVSVSSSALPAGAATAAKQDTTIASLASVDGKLPALSGGRIPVDPSGVTQPVSAAALPLPSGAATSALQTTGNGSLSAIDGKLPALVDGRVPVDGSGVTTPTREVAATGAADSTVAVSLTSVTLCAANAARIGLLVVNNSTDVLYVSLGTAATTSHMGLDPGATWEMPRRYTTAAIYGIWADGVGSALVQELT